MTSTPHGRYLVAGTWIVGKDTFMSEPATGPVRALGVGTVELVDMACRAAEDAFWIYGYSTRQERAAILESIADEFEARGFCRKLKV